MKTIRDTHILLFRANGPGRLTAQTHKALESGLKESTLIGPDITWWDYNAPRKLDSVIRGNRTLSIRGI